MAINIGRMDRRITIQQFTSAQNSAGEPIETWTALATVWGSKMDITGRERFTSQQQLEEETTVFRIRYRSDVTVKMRLVCETKTYRIDAIAEMGRRRALDITGTAILP